MQSFKDLKGNNWTISFTSGDARRLQRELGIDVDKLTSGDDQTIEKLLESSWLMVEILVLVLEKQIESRNLVETFSEDITKKVMVDSKLEEITETVTKRRVSDEFFDLFDGSIIDEATLAFLKAVGDSLPKLKRRALLAMMERLSEIVETGTRGIESKIRGMNYPEMMEAEISKIEL